MGITINDSLTLKVGITKTGTYSSFAKDRVTITSNDDSTYILTSIARIWADKTARDANSPSLQSLRITVGITTDDLEDNLYTLLYTELKTNYTSTTDV